MLFHVSLCATLVPLAVATPLQLDEPWDSILFYVVFGTWSVVLPCWGGFCLAFAVLLRRRGHAGSVKQIQTLLGISIPFFGLGYYDNVVRGLLRPQTEGNSSPRDGPRGFPHARVRAEDEIRPVG